MTTQFPRPARSSFVPPQRSSLASVSMPLTSSQRYADSTGMASNGNSIMERDRRQSARRITISTGGTQSAMMNNNTNGTNNLLDSQLEESHMFKVMIDGDDGGVDMRVVHERIEAALHTRNAYKREIEDLANEAFDPLPSRITIGQTGGTYEVSGHDVETFYELPSWQQYAADVQMVKLTAGNTTCIKACEHRLGIIQERSRMFFLLNSEIEEQHNLRKAGGVFATVAKVDNCVALNKCADAQELLEVVVDTCMRSPGAMVRLRDGTTTTLQELLSKHNVEHPALLSVEGLGWQPRVSKPYFTESAPEKSPLSEELRFIFMNPHSFMSPKVLRRVFERSERSVRSPQAAEYGLTLYGAYANEVPDIAKSLQGNALGPYKRVRYILQIRLQDEPPAAYSNDAQTVQDQLDHVFLPLLKATIAPNSGDNASVAWMMQQMGGFQLESQTDGPDRDFDSSERAPETVPSRPVQNQLYYFYYLYANVTVLNSLRRRKGLNTFQLRSGGSLRTAMDELTGGYLLADVITRATNLLHYPVLQYLCGLRQVGLTVSPLSDHVVGTVAYQKHPLPGFLHRCLRVAVATDAPLLYHHNPNALAQEYATAQKMFRLSPLDVTELARTSVVISSFSHDVKKEWLGENYRDGLAGNEFELSQVTNIRLAFREEVWQQERSMMRDLYIHRVHELGAGLNRWHFLSNVQEVEYNTVLDARIRFPRTVLSGPQRKGKTSSAAAKVARALDMRRRYIWQPPKPWEEMQHRGVESDFQRRTDTFNEDEWTYAASDAVFIAYARSAVHEWPRTLPTLDDFHKDLQDLQQICASADVKEFAHQRLENLDHKFRLHLALNHANEAGTTEERSSSNRDIYQATKVDTHIHMAAGMTPRQMLTFVLKKLQENPDDIAMKKGDDIITLGQLFKKAGITPRLTVDQLSVQADYTLFERFDNFNNRYNPMENGDLRSLMLKTDNFINGRYFAELIHDIFAQYSRDRYTYAENRVSVYGISIKEWDKLAAWFTTHGMSNKHNKWIIQVPRVYKVFRAQNVIGSFGQYLQNIFQPLWEASLHPAEHPTLHNFLKHVSGFDSVDNEATLDLPFTPVSPWAWTAVENPPYNYYLYYLYANIRTLNEFRASRGFTTFALRPHCGESGSDEHLYGAFLCANSICHGINLRNDPPMQYLYYLTQIGLHVSPLSNNALFLRFLNNPFPDFFRRGLNVSLSTDDPMMFHQTQEPLIEEYSIAARVWGLSPNDLCEIARNSVLQSGFDSQFKREAIGDRWYMSSSLGNDPLRTHLSDIRIAYRFETYHTEVRQLEQSATRSVERFMLTSDEERAINELNVDPTPETIILSTHDQAMEVMLRDIEAKREELRVSKLHLEFLRRQQRSLVDNITDVGEKRAKREEQERARGHEKLRDLGGVIRPEENGATRRRSGGTFQTAESEAVQRLLRWRPMPPNVLHHVKEQNVSLQRGRALPPISFQ